MLTFEKWIGRQRIIKSLVESGLDPEGYNLDLLSEGLGDQLKKWGMRLAIPAALLAGAALGGSSHKSDSDSSPSTSIQTTGGSAMMNRLNRDRSDRQKKIDQLKKSGKTQGTFVHGKLVPDQTKTAGTRTSGDLGSF